MKPRAKKRKPELAFGALQHQHNLFGGLGLLVEDGLRLSPESLLLPVITTLSQLDQRSSTFLVLTNLVNGVFFQLRAKGPQFLRNVNLKKQKSNDSSEERKMKTMRVKEYRPLLIGVRSVWSGGDIFWTKIKVSRSFFMNRAPTLASSHPEFCASKPV
jgi:hypothetical protein